jgi:phosphatidylserine/phosphatidylglycerophosphate/cardiolipin synthase-like enzyme
MRIILLLLLLLSGNIFSATATEHTVVYFSPNDQVEKRLISMIEKEQKSIAVAIYCMTHRGIGNALIEAKRRGVDVEVIVDRFSVRVKAPLGKMVEAGIPVYVWDPDPGRRKKAHRPLMHHKFCVFGDEAVWTGSFNFTYEASRMHEENALLIRDPDLAAAFKNQFINIKFKSCVPFGSYVAAHSSKFNKRRSLSSVR